MKTLVDGETLLLFRPVVVVPTTRNSHHGLFVNLALVLVLIIMMMVECL